RVRGNSPWRQSCPAIRCRLTGPTVSERVMESHAEPEANGKDPDLERVVRAIVFDTFGTLVDWRGSLTNGLRAFGEENGLEAPWEKLADSWRGAYHPSLDRVRRGELEWTILDELHYAALVKLLPEFGIEALPEADL